MTWWRALALACVLALGCGGCGDDDDDADPTPESEDSGPDDASKDSGREDARTPPPPRDAGRPCEADADCADDRRCNGDERCAGGRCMAGQPIRCDDRIDCTTDRCDELIAGCVSEPPDLDQDGVFDASCKRADGGALGTDCDDRDARRYPGNIEECDPAHHDEDCDPSTNGEVDADDDGYRDDRCCNRIVDEADGELRCGTDCDDRKANVNPEASEVCDAFDNDCDGQTDEGVTVMAYPDRDHDGHGSERLDAGWDCAHIDPALQLLRPERVCPDTRHYSVHDDDCDDCEPDRYPGLVEVCDQKDNNCNELVDDNPQVVSWYLDLDGDNFGGDVAIESCIPVSRHVRASTDCDDDDPTVNPAADEVCDGRDNDCSGGSDFMIGTNDFEDDDGDGIADALCEPAGKDCDDRNPLTAEGRSEVCDGRDNDCNGSIDEGTVATVWYKDRDRDGFGDPFAAQDVFCGQLGERAAIAGDCNDGNPAAYPGAVERCDGLDTDCDSLADNQEPAAQAECRGAPHTLQTRCDVEAGGCKLTACAAGYLDCNVDARDGCESAGTACAAGTAVGRCVAGTWNGVAGACAQCLCSADAASGSECDASCWELATCTATRCGSLDDEDCMGEQCSMYLAGLVGLREHRVAIASCPACVQELDDPLMADLAECKASLGSGVGAGCADCMCACDHEAVTGCDAACWQLLNCVRQKCGNLDSPTCLNANCGAPEPAVVARAKAAQPCLRKRFLGEFSYECETSCADVLGTRANCLAQASPNLPPGCAQCLCGCDPGLGHYCGDACWLGVACMHQRCGDNLADTYCRGQQCAAVANDLPGGPSSPTSASCVQSCGQNACAPLLEQTIPVNPDLDGGL